MEKEQNMPKKIHYCWFGGKELTKEAKECIASWKKSMPDYEVIQWDESNIDLDNCQYAKEAYEHKKWAFVSDYYRYEILYKYGGIYLDTDVMMLKSLEPILKQGPYFGREQERDGGFVSSGLGMAAASHHEFYKEMLDCYQSESFINPDGSENLKTVVIRMTDLLVKHGYSLDRPYDEIQEVDGIKIYPGEYFCPRGYNGVTNITENSYTVHLFSASWFSEDDQKRMRYSRKINNAGFFGKCWWYLRLWLLEVRNKK